MIARVFTDHATARSNFKPLTYVDIFVLTVCPPVRHSSLAYAACDQDQKPSTPGHTAFGLLILRHLPIHYMACKRHDSSGDVVFQRFHFGGNIEVYRDVRYFEKGRFGRTFICMLREFDAPMSP
ncbi:hypothetical protein P171DRAFT_83376 [Karstenula rhodostoma CBS 690.94]|uniref:Uncharacterized protein n=1 Tax=Karstenula rhodostoma CBS 690.94 TaxID=1392251 RepID=A0A9P4UA77_9PLEO|nr:hypothetical protein P171DRAFT_83376 [Karstenula rhodostoma CBS 690.94]